MSNQRVLRSGVKGTPEQLRQAALRRRHPAGVKEPVVAPSQAAIREAIEAQTCPFCGRGPFKMLPVHTNKTHGVDKWELRDLAGLTTRDALCSPEALAKMAAAYDPDQGALARAAAAARTRRPQRWTRAGRERNTATITRWMQENPDAAAEAARVGSASVTAEGRARQGASLRAWYEAHPMDDEARRIAAARLQSPEAAAARARTLAARLQGCGTVASYKRGCRCDDCRAAKAASRRERKQA